jgi:hypothetical protein
LESEAKLTVSGNKRVEWGDKTVTQRVRRLSGFESLTKIDEAAAKIDRKQFGLKEVSRARTQKSRKSGIFSHSIIL